MCELRNVLDVLLSASWKVDWPYFVLTALGLVCGLCNYNRYRMSNKKFNFKVLFNVQCDSFSFNIFLINH